MGTMQVNATKIRASFETQPYTTARRGQPAPKSVIRPAHSPARKSRPFSGLFVVLAACALILSVALSGTDILANAIGQVGGVLASNVSLHDTLGKLKFVRDDTLEVFGQPRAAMPIEEPTATTAFSGDNASVTLVGVPFCEVYACFDGVARQVIVQDDGTTLVVDHGKSTFYYMSVAHAAVEPGQPLKKGDAIGRTGEGGILRLVVYQEGEPVDPLSILGLRPR